MTEATQRPWYATHDGTTYYHIQSAAINEDNYVARVDAMDSQGDANADLIVKAVNSHDAIVAVFEQTDEYIKLHDIDDDAHTLGIVAGLIAAALEAAK